MREIQYSVGTRCGSISWVANEDFSELEGKTFSLSSTKAVDIEKMDLSNHSKILLSAVAGATIQHMIDLHIRVDEIFRQGQMRI